MKDSRQDALLKEYGEVSNNFRSLLDIRFRMLNLLPIVSGLAVGLLTHKQDLNVMDSLIIALFGLVITIGLITYNARNDQLYDELVGRAAAIERHLGLPDGNFANRPTAWLVIKFGSIKWQVNHRNAIAIIYAASFTLWLSKFLAAVLELSRKVYLEFGCPPLFLVPDLLMLMLVNGSALALAVGLTWRGAISIKAQLKNREDSMRKQAAEAYKMVLSGNNLHKAIENDKFIDLCLKLSTGEEYITDKTDKADILRAVTDTENRIKQKPSKLGLSALFKIRIRDHAEYKTDNIAKKRKELKRRAEYYLRLDPDYLGYYGLRGSKQQVASHIVAQLTDLPPGWIFDCGENRKGKIPDESEKQAVNKAVRPTIAE